jgi:hypothetical protein
MARIERQSCNRIHLQRCVAHTVATVMHNQVDAEARQTNGRMLKNDLIELK